VPTDRRYTGQRQESVGLGNLYDYGARFYSPALGRFLSADTIVPEPGNPQTWNRFSYVFNQALNLIDPSSHRSICDEDDPCVDPVAWDQDALEKTTPTDRHEAEVAYYDFLVDPAKYLSYLMNPATAAEHSEYNALSFYAEGVHHIPVEEFILGNFPGLTSDMLTTSQYETWPANVGAAALPVGGVYVLRNSDKIVMYIGRTNDLARRLLEHQRIHLELKFDPLVRTNSYEVQRGVEQMLYDKYKPPLNKIRPISLTNPRLQKYLRAGRTFLFGGGRREKG